MTDLKILNDQCLLSETLRLVRQERELLALILHHLREIERRRLYGTHSSLYDYATAVLGYSSDQAYRRIQAARLIGDLPEVEAKIESGQINLTHIGLAHSLFKAEKKNGRALSPKNKLEVFEAMAGQSTREAQRTVQSFSPEKIRIEETVKPLGDGRNALTIEISDLTLATLEKLKGGLAHQCPDLTFGQLVGRLAEAAAERSNPAKPPTKQTSEFSRAAIRRAVWRRDRGACGRCGSTHALEVDHRVPKSMGGEDTLGNMRLLCRACNQRAAIETLGLGKMEPHLKRAADRG
jgi:hypothetical protein